MVNISACHAEDPGSIPGRGVCIHKRLASCRVLPLLAGWAVVDDVFVLLECMCVCVCVFGWVCCVLWFIACVCSVCFAVFALCAVLCAKLFWGYVWGKLCAVFLLCMGICVSSPLVHGFVLHDCVRTCVGLPMLVQVLGALCYVCVCVFVSSCLFVWFLRSCLRVAAACFSPNPFKAGAPLV